MQEIIDNTTSEKEKTIKNMVDGYAREEGIANRAGLVENIYLDDSVFFGFEKKNYSRNS